jgi:hypothetical protein
MAILCFCPPDNLTPLYPTKVSNLSGNVSGFNANDLAFAIYSDFNTF